MPSIIYSHPTHIGIIIGSQRKNLQTIERRYGVYIDITTIKNIKKLDEFNKPYSLNDYNWCFHNYLSKIKIWKQIESVNDSNIRECEQYIISVLDVSISNLKKSIEEYTNYSNKVIQCFKLGHTEANRALPCKKCKIRHISCLGGKQCCRIGPTIRPGFRNYMVCYTCHASL